MPKGKAHNHKEENKMTKMEMMEKLYGRSEELEKKFDAAEKVGDAQTMQACRDAYQELVKEVQAEGEDSGDDFLKGFHPYACLF